MPTSHRVSPPAPHRLAFGRRIRELRTDRGLSQEGLGQCSDLHRTYVGKIERGEVSTSVDCVHRLANGLGIEVRELFAQD